MMPSDSDVKSRPAEFPFVAGPEAPGYANAAIFARELLGLFAHDVLGVYAAFIAIFA
jgi:hypothetical protein